MRHRTEMQQGEEMADAQPLDAVYQLVTHRCGTAGNQEAALDEILILEFAQIEPLAQRRPQAAQQTG